MKKNIFFFVILSATTLSCSFFDTSEDTMMDRAMLESDWSKLKNVGYTAYTYMSGGLYAIDGNIDAPKSDEAVSTGDSPNVRHFNEGTWNQYNNPDNAWTSCYKGIRAANFFLEYSVDYKNMLATGRDTLSDGGYSYRRSVQDIEWLRAENRVLRAWFYFELSKRYGGVPIVKEAGEPDAYNLPRATFDEVTDYSVTEIDAVSQDLQPDWRSFDSERDGRFTQGAALALKARILLYAASLRNNPGNDVSKWEMAAKAAHDVMALERYSLASDYRALFLESESLLSPEVIMSYRYGAVNLPERNNYPVGTPGGNSGVTPSQNMVDAYGYKSVQDKDNPYSGRDPRLEYSIAVNGSTWNGRKLEIWAGGSDDPSERNASKTGYYLKKFMPDNIDLAKDEKRMHNWIVFRYAEILLSYAEAMNEAYGPDSDPLGYGMTARQAVNEVRHRKGVEMPDVEASDKTSMRERIMNERMVELAFEGHRFWDLIRMEKADAVLGSPVYGISISKAGGKFTYKQVEVEKRQFDASKMYYYPIPYEEISKSHGVLVQNAGW